MNDPNPGGETAQDMTTGPMFCYRHPKVETGLRCNRCGKPICPKCAIRTHVGYRCPECIKEQKSVYYNNRSYDYAIAAAITLPLAVVAGLVLSNLGFLVIFLGPGAGALIAEIVRRAVGRRRGRYLALTVGVCSVLGALPSIAYPFIGLIGLIHNPELAAHVGYGMLWPLFFMVLFVGTAYGRLR